MRRHLGRKKARAIGPLDMSRNGLLRAVNRWAVSYTPPPLVGGLSEELALLIGDATGQPTVKRYAKLGGRPMPSSMVSHLARCQRFTLACRECGVNVAWGKDRPILRVVTPDLLDGFADPELPGQPVVLREARERRIGDRWVRVVDEWSVQDPERPTYRVLAGGELDAATQVLAGAEDLTRQALGETFDGDDYPWRWEAGTGAPYIPWVIYHAEEHGELWDPYAGIELSEGALYVAVLWSYWGHMVKDAGFPQRWTIGLVPAGADTGEGDADGSQGVETGPATILHLVAEDPSRPGATGQWGPGADVRTVQEAITAYEQNLEDNLIPPIEFSSTGGDPLESARKAREQRIRAFAPANRQYDCMLFERIAAVASAEFDKRFAESGYTALYRDEIEDSADTDTDTKEKPADDQAGSGRDQDPKENTRG